MTERRDSGSEPETANATVLAAIAHRRAAGERIVFTNGCFDLLHPGHVESLRRARVLGDCLVVGVNSDASVRALKGPERPFITHVERAELLRALRSVDYAVVFEQASPAELIRAIRPHVYAKGADWRTRALPEADAIAEVGARVEYVDLLPGYSTSTLVERIRALTDD